MRPVLFVLEMVALVAVGLVVATWPPKAEAQGYVPVGSEVPTSHSPAGRPMYPVGQPVPQMYPPANQIPESWQAGGYRESWTESRVHDVYPLAPGAGAAQAMGVYPQQQPTLAPATQWVPSRPEYAPPTTTYVQPTYSQPVQWSTAPTYTYPTYSSGTYNCVPQTQYYCYPQGQQYYYYYQPRKSSCWPWW